MFTKCTCCSVVITIVVENVIWSHFPFRNASKSGGAYAERKTYRFRIISHCLPH